MTERIGEKFSDESENKKTSIPDAKYFKELMVEKPGEVEFEKPKKRQFATEEEEEEPDDQITAAAPTPYEPSYYTPENIDTEEDVDLPSSPEFWDEVSIPTSSENLDQSSTQLTSQDQGAKTPSTKKTEKKDVEGIFHDKTKEMEATLSAGKKPLNTKEDLQDKLQKTPSFPKDTKGPSPFESLPSSYEKEKETFPSEKTSHERITLPPTLPSAIAMQADAACAKAEPFLQANPILPLLFHQIVGTVLVMQQRGITTTEVILNNPQFASSALYESRLVLERYSTAPDSFNIRLIGNPQAVQLFDANMEQLQTAFTNGNFDFRINLIRTEHERERFLFHRKEDISRDSKGNQDTTRE